ncbi:MAG: cell division ATP-binding protein FtsE [Bacteroidia bacterium]|jgi:cell division transport system ATP-binding protein
MNEILKVQDLSVSHDGMNILKGVNFSLNKGEYSYLIGKTGSGKSTMMRSFYADHDIDSGSVEICGFQLPGLPKRDVPKLRRKVGIVFQDFQLLFDRNVYSNLSFVLEATGWKDQSLMKSRMNEVLELVHLPHILDKSPHQLSGGEQQRLAIARALLNHPEIILADEPTGNLDPDTSLEIIQLFKDIAAKGTAVLLATHDYYIIEKHPARLFKVEDAQLFDLGHILFE